MRILDNPETDADGEKLPGFAERLSQAIAHTKLNQSEFARKIEVSPGFVSEMVRGNKKPGAEFLRAVRLEFGISIDWLLIGEGTMMGARNIDLDLLRSIRLYVALARSAVIDENPMAKLLSSVLRNAKLAELTKETEFENLLNDLSVTVTDDERLALELYNGHLWTRDPVEQQSNLLSAALAYFESRKPFNKMAAISRGLGAALQINIASNQRNAGRDYIEE